MFARGSLSLQCMFREVRNTIARDYYHDVDMANAHPVILRQFCDKLGIPCPVLASYIERRDTNHPEKFDPALTRPGRLDTFHFEKLGPPEIAQFWRLYFDEDPPADAPTSATMAELTTLMSRWTRKIP